MKRIDRKESVGGKRQKKNWICLKNKLNWHLKKLKSKNKKSVQRNRMILNLNYLTEDRRYQLATKKRNNVKTYDVMIMW